MKKHPAVFLDRDGTLIEDVGYIKNELDIIFFKETFEALHLLQDDFLLFIVTNQSGIGKGVLKSKEVEKVNNYLVEYLKASGITIYDVFTCPHINEDRCTCKKPSPYFLNLASQLYNIDLKRSYMIGDHPSDVECGDNAGAEGIYLLTGHGEKHLNELKTIPVVKENIYQAASYIKNKKI